jgi:Ni/Co efflux regulator RcnB
MRKLLLALSALAVLGIAGPLSAPAQAEEGRVVIREHRDHPRFFERFRHHDRDFERFRRHDRDSERFRHHDRDSERFRHHDRGHDY